MEILYIPAMALGLVEEQYLLPERKNKMKKNFFFFLCVMGVVACAAVIIMNMYQYRVQYAIDHPATAVVCSVSTPCVTATP
jgi:hypothetical protein